MPKWVTAIVFYAKKYTDIQKILYKMYKICSYLF